MYPVISGLPLWTRIPSETAIHFSGAHGGTER